MVRSTLKSVLWPMYLFFLAWLFVPLYAGVLGSALPVPTSDIDLLLTLATLAIGPIGYWSGSRGGPLLLSEPVVLFDLVLGAGSPRLGQAVVQHALLAAGFGGLIGTALSTLAVGSKIDYAVILRHTVQGLMIGWLVVSVAVLFSIGGVRGGRDRVLAVVLSLAPAPAVLGFGSGWASALVLGFVGLVGLAVAVWRSAAVPVPNLWARAGSLARLKVNATMLLDLRGVLSELRQVRDGPRVFRTHLVGLSRLPLSMWRTARSLSSAPAVSWGRLGAVPVAIAVGFATMSETNGRLIIGAVLLFIAGIDLTTPLASLAARPELLNVGNRRVISVLVGHLAIVVVIMVSLALVAWLLAAPMGDQTPLLAWLGVALGIAVATSLQARNGAADLGTLLNRHGVAGLGAAIGMRSAAPFVVALAAVSGMSRVATQSLALVDLAWVAVLVLATLGVVGPLELRR